MEKEYTAIRRFYSWVGFITLILLIVGGIAWALGAFTVTISF